MCKGVDRDGKGIGTLDLDLEPVNNNKIIIIKNDRTYHVLIFPPSKL